MQSNIRTSAARKADSFTDKETVKHMSFSDIVAVDPDWLKEQIVLLTPSDASGAYKFKYTYLADSILSKLYTPGLSDPVALRKAAYASFDQGEIDCALRNQNGLTVSRSILRTARKLMKVILGDFSYEKVLLNCKHGSGATAARSRAFGEPHNKYAVREQRRYYSRKRKKYIVAKPLLSVTPLALKYWSALCKVTPMLLSVGDDNNVFLVRGNTLDTVPKNSETDRTIAKEPDINMFLQLGVGDYLARRLTFFKNSKFDQTRNQLLAKLGSMYGHLATIDLSRASDSISFKLVYELLPSDWLEYLDAIRSHYYTRDDIVGYKAFDKFCTMGNGFCFELQTMMFLCLSLAAAGEKDFSKVGDCFSTYGDDIICPSHVSSAVIETLNHCGFTVNEKKSFTAGPFRESCGKHYYYGTDVTPFYVRRPIDSIERVCWLLNSLRKWAYDVEHAVCDDTIYPLWNKIYKSNAVFRKLRGGRNIDRIDYVVSPGRPTSRLIAKTQKLVVNELGAYVCKMAQGLVSNDKIPEMLMYDEQNRIIFDSFHYTVHPESSTYEVLGLTRNPEGELPPSEYKFLTELR